MRNLRMLLERGSALRFLLLLAISNVLQENVILAQTTRFAVG